jgi:GT2 family glycosyltransferase
MSAPVAIVIVTWNSHDSIRACLESARAVEVQEIVIVDNGSVDGTTQLITEGFPEVRLIRETENTGFAAGCNKGAHATHAANVLFLNADARLEADYVRTLLSALERRPHAASAVGKLVYEDGGRRYIDSAGIELGRLSLCPRDRGKDELDEGQYDREELIFGPTGAAALYRRAALAEAGVRPFDEDLFAYYEDVDLAWRLARRGWQHVYVPAAIAYHRRNGAEAHPRSIQERAFVNRYIVWLKNESLWRFLVYAPVAIPWEAIRLLRTAKRQGTTVGALLLAALRRVLAPSVH